MAGISLNFNPDIFAELDEMDESRVPQRPPLPERTEAAPPLNHAQTQAAQRSTAERMRLFSATFRSTVERTGPFSATVLTRNDDPASNLVNLAGSQAGLMMGADNPSDADRHSRLMNLIIADGRPSNHRSGPAQPAQDRAEGAPPAYRARNANGMSAAIRAHLLIPPEDVASRAMAAAEIALAANAETIYVVDDSASMQPSPGVTDRARADRARSGIELSVVLSAMHGMLLESQFNAQQTEHRGGRVSPSPSEPSERRNAGQGIQALFRSQGLSPEEINPRASEQETAFTNLVSFLSGTEETDAPFGSASDSSDPVKKKEALRNDVRSTLKTLLARHEALGRGNQRSSLINEFDDFQSAFEEANEADAIPGSANVSYEPMINHVNMQIGGNVSPFSASRWAEFGGPTS